MNIDLLNTRYGAPGRIVFRPGHCGCPNVVLANKFGVAEIALMGGNVLSYRPTGHAETIFRPSKRDYNRGEPFHGGIPVCFPQFGNRLSKALPKHGFARALPFAVKATEYSDESTGISLLLKADDATRSMWPHDFELELKVSVSMKLNLSLSVANTGADPFEFSCGFHPYILLRERDTAVVKGLDGMSFLDADTGGEGVWTGDFPLDRATDHVFSLPPAARHEFAVIDPALRRAVAVVSTGNDRAVVWNPGPSAALADLDADSWRRFICIEPVSNWPGGNHLAPGEKYTLAAAVQSTLEPGEQ